MAKRCKKESTYTITTYNGQSYDCLTFNEYNPAVVLPNAMSRWWIRRPNFQRNSSVRLLNIRMVINTSITSGSKCLKFVFPNRSSLKHRTAFNGGTLPRWQFPSPPETFTSFILQVVYHLSLRHVLMTLDVLIWPQNRSRRATLRLHQCIPSITNNYVYNKSIN